MTQSLQANRQWLKTLFSRYHEIGHIRENFDRLLENHYGISNERPVATGHQPVIYHPGLLFKNHFTGQAARQMGTTPAINLVVDTDLAHVNVPVPAYSHGEPVKTFARIANEKELTFSAFHPSHEQVQAFFTFIREHITSLAQDRITEAFDQYKAAFDQAYRDGSSFVDALVILRNRFDAWLGYPIRDVKVSGLARSFPYWQYIAFILQHIEAYRTAYNQAIEENRRKDYQPVRFMHQYQGWIELPFWLEDNGQRHSVYFKKQPGQFRFWAPEAQREITLSLNGTTPEQVAEQLQEHLILYPKATTLTQLIRLFLCDVFVHGSGAAEYEQVNNRFLQLFFSMDRAPAFYTATGDLYLPFSDDMPDLKDVKADHHRKSKWLREAHRNPEGQLDNRLAEQYKKKKKAIAQKMSQENQPERRKDYHHQLQEVDRQIKEELKPQIEQVKQELAHYESLLEKQDVYFERRYPYFLYPAEELTQENFREHLRVKRH